MIRLNIFVLPWETRIQSMICVQILFCISLYCWVRSVILWCAARNLSEPRKEIASANEVSYAKSDEIPILKTPTPLPRYDVNNKHYLVFLVAFITLVQSGIYRRVAPCMVSGINEYWKGKRHVSFLLISLVGLFLKPPYQPRVLLLLVHHHCMVSIINIVLFFLLHLLCWCEWYLPVWGNASAALLGPSGPHPQKKKNFFSSSPQKNLQPLKKGPSLFKRKWTCKRFFYCT